MKGLGVKPGVPDILIPIPHNGWSGFAAELKSPSGRLTEHQSAWLDQLARCGYLACVCKTIDEFVAAALRYAQKKPAE